MKYMMILQRYVKYSYKDFVAPFRTIVNFDPNKPYMPYEYSSEDPQFLTFTKKRDIYLIDKYTDGTAFGGLSDAKYKLDKDNLLSVQGMLKSDPERLVVLDDLFAGIATQLYPRLLLQDYNGLRIAVKSTTPLTVILLGIVPSVKMWHFLADIVDCSQNSIQEYELPLELFSTNRGQKLYPRGTTLSHMAVVARGVDDTPFHFCLKSVTLIKNPEFDKIKTVYKENVMFKRKNSYIQEGIDTGRAKFYISSDKENAKKQLYKH